MSEVYKVQSGVPVPPINRAPKDPARKYPIGDLEVGDFFFAPGKDTKALSAYVSRVAKHIPGKFTARHCWMRRDGVGDWQPASETERGAVEGTGVWRVK